MSVYQGQSAVKGDASTYIVVVAVNWDDTADTAVTYDLVANKIAFSRFDSCVTVDLWTGEATKHSGGV